MSNRESSDNHNRESPQEKLDKLETALQCTYLAIRIILVLLAAAGIGHLAALL